jgi:hypothetical protein
MLAGLRGGGVVIVGDVEVRDEMGMTLISKLSIHGTASAESSDDLNELYFNRGQLFAISVFPSLRVQIRSFGVHLWFSSGGRPESADLIKSEPATKNRRTEPENVDYQFMYLLPQV